MSLKRLLRDVRACRICEPDLPLGPRPVFRLARSARLLIISQAPSRKVHQSGLPWDDASGARLREWMMIDAMNFYDQSSVAVLPMGLLLSRRWPARRRQSAQTGMRTPLAQTIVGTSSEFAIDAPGRSVRPPPLFGIKTKRIDDRNRQGILAVRADILSVTASELAQRILDAKEYMV